MSLDILHNKSITYGRDARNDAVYNQLIDRMNPRIFRLFYGFTRDHSISNQWVIEAFATAYRNRSHVLLSDHNDTPVIQLYKIAFNILIQNKDKIDHMQGPPVPSPKDKRQGVESFAAMPEEGRVFVYLKSMEDLNDGQLAEMSGMSEGDVRRSLYNARHAALRAMNTHKCVA